MCVSAAFEQSWVNPNEMCYNIIPSLLADAICQSPTFRCKMNDVMQCLRIVVLSVVGIATGQAAFAQVPPIDFNNDVRPILSNKCLLCHGPDEGIREGGLRLDTRDTATTELDSGDTGVVPGQPAASSILDRITSDDEDIRMPPADHGEKLTPAEIQILTDWIKQGAKYATHWSYVKPVRPELSQPDARYKSWVKNPIDHFTLPAILKHNFKPTPEADRATLARRVFLDLTGLPPTVEEVAAFINNKDARAYEQLVDELLSRSAFGEHWARKWLDLARYADSAGYADDPPRTIWAYRDWVIQAINDDMPFDQFTIEQMAGDLLPDPTESQLVATAFHRNTLTNNEGGTQDEEFRNEAVVDRVNTTMAVWMGTTMACAQCHTHKYDPITQEEYFQFFAILNSTQDADRRNESPRLEIFTPEQKTTQANLDARIAQLKKTIETPSVALLASQNTWEQSLAQSAQNAKWQPLKPAVVKRKSKKPAKILEDGSVLVTATAKTDSYTINIPFTKATTLAALRLETLPHESLPGKGSGFGGGNFVMTSVKVQLVPRGRRVPQAKFVRVTNNGKDKILSLAEVQVFSGTKNIAIQGKATQQSTAFAGPANLANDGNTDGDFQKKSVTHTATIANPWWEVDLGSEQPIEKVVLWNRTDNGLHTRLGNYTIELLDSAREVVVKQVFKTAPNPSAQYSPTNVRDVVLTAAYADYHQPGFEPAGVLAGKNGNTDGWAVGGATNVAHQLVLVPKKKFTVSSDDTLRITIDQNSKHAEHLLGHFRFSGTDDAAVILRSQIPAGQLAVLEKPADQRTAGEGIALAAYYRSNVAKELSKERTELAKATTRRAGLKPATSVPILRELAKGRETYLQHRGSYLDKGQKVTAGTPSIFHPITSLTADSKVPDRLAMAKWLVDEDNPLTSRVIANRFWETLFGRGIVLSSEEFGSQGELPTHPQLLDWLATELTLNQWNTRHLIRTMVMSATYRQSAVVAADVVAADPDNRWLSRGPRIRLSAEMVRDQALAVSGLLSQKLFGPPVNPPQPNLGLTAAFGGSTDWKTSAGEDRYRRGLYTSWRRSNPYPSMATFDAPNREVCTVRRNRTNTPLQSLVTLNDPVYVEAAQSLARKALAFGGPLDRQIAFAFKRCVLRSPTPQELTALVQLFNDSKAQLSGKDVEAKQLATEPLGMLPKEMSVMDAAAMTVVGNVLLNLDEMFLKR